MPAFMMPVLLLGGIRFGVFTPTEGGAFACVYAIAVCTLYYRELTFKGLLAVSARAARTTSVVMLIVATATAVGWFITSAQIPMQVAELFQPLVGVPDSSAAFDQRLPVPCGHGDGPDAERADLVRRCSTR